LELDKLYEKYREHTMVPRGAFFVNLAIAERLRNVPGCVVECGVWKGGMVAAIADVLGPARRYFLFDSFEGLPPARHIDGDSALAWQRNESSPTYYNNCTASRADAEAAMRSSAAADYHIIQGWFEDTLSTFASTEPIALLRLDGDWYDSTYECLRRLAHQVHQHGQIIVDDYHTWTGCARAVHDFLSEASGAFRLNVVDNSVCTMVRNNNP
jgi:hypothetical protein